MKSGSPQESGQAMQRVRVGMTGLAVVLVLIALASAIFSSASREESVAAVGASNAMVVANIADDLFNTTARDEPLAELGVAPSAASTGTPKGEGQAQPQ